MKHLSAVCLFAFASTLAPPAIAQSEEVGVPILEAPYHLPVFTNSYVTVLKILIPPERNTGYHTHTEDSVSVNILTADRTNQNLGSAGVTPAEAGQRGRATYTAYSKEGPRTHKGQQYRPDALPQCFVYLQQSRAGTIHAITAGERSRLCGNHGQRACARLAPGAGTGPVCSGDCADGAGDPDRSGWGRACRERAPTCGPRMDARQRGILLAGARHHSRASQYRHDTH